MNLKIYCQKLYLESVIDPLSKNTNSDHIGMEHLSIMQNLNVLFFVLEEHSFTNWEKFLYYISLFNFDRSYIGNEKCKCNFFYFKRKTTYLFTVKIIKCIKYEAYYCAHIQWTTH